MGIPGELSFKSPTGNGKRNFIKNVPGIQVKLVTAEPDIFI